MLSLVGLISVTEEDVDELITDVCVAVATIVALAWAEVVLLLAGIVVVIVICVGYREVDTA